MAAPELFNMVPRGPFQQKFDGSQETDRLSITVQFYLAEINMYCHQHDIGYQNFGLLLQNTDLRRAFLDCLRGSTLETIEHRLFEFVSQHHVEFKLFRPLDINDFKAIQKDFYVHFSSVMGSPHYDEFSVLNFEKNGGFYSHGSKICVDYLDYLKEAIPNHTLNQDPQMQEILEQSKQLPVNTYHAVKEIKDLSLEEKKEWVAQGYPLGFLLSSLNASQQVELLMNFGKFGLDILEGSRQEMQNLNGIIAPLALSYLQELSIAHDKSNMFKLNPEQMECRETLERLSQSFPEESKWLRALLIRDENVVSRGLENFPKMPTEFIHEVFAQKTLLARINHILEERDAPPLKKPEDLAVYRNVTADFKSRLSNESPNSVVEEVQQPNYKQP
ncbi:MAG: hypothetical protein EBQ95_05150 [Gammaproteobacteria bacterium]|nr:hypothetical protein [Gammaproteobacteria bacterium]